MESLSRKRQGINTATTPAKTAEALNEETDPFLPSIVLLALCTGMRRGALLGLRWEDVNFERGFITLAGVSAKKNQTSTIPLKRAEPYMRLPWMTS